MPKVTYYRGLFWLVCCHTSDGWYVWIPSAKKWEKRKVLNVWSERELTRISRLDALLEGVLPCLK